MDMDTTKEEEGLPFDTIHARDLENEGGRLQKSHTRRQRDVEMCLLEREQREKLDIFPKNALYHFTTKKNLLVPHKEY